MLYNPVNAGLRRGQRLSLGPDRLVSARRFGTTDDAAARGKSSMVAGIVKEELRGEAGAQFLRQVRQIVKREMGKYATRHEMKKSQE
ncbi:MAG: hypothetical protein OXI87_06970 [Albidovulum sp.]|nr:hypothetical protein [Albidovulum sp.]MDE0531518.1 hypothetical protein [Albidovulum sp.]